MIALSCFSYLDKLQVFIQHIQLKLTFQSAVQGGKWPSNPRMSVEKSVFRYIFCVLNCHVFGADD